MNVFKRKENPLQSIHQNTIFLFEHKMYIVLCDVMATGDGTL